MIIGAHAVIHATNAEQTRAFFRDILGFSSVDAGGGWLVFAMPPAEISVNPTEGEVRHEFYLICDDLKATVAELAAKGVEFVSDAGDDELGNVAVVKVPGGGELGIYQATHPTALAPAP
ncbi:VOC family protein [Actinopolymorpha alba]|uniref:VOC family protein n=1 Tax=Actinopolymorpha alba TaxID=533267 RepID=UPI0003737E75|nr:VOC family protein [Actinopolymorpha alba]